MRYMNADQRFKVVSVAAWCNWHTLDDSRRFGAALRQAIAASERTVAVLASGSLSHRFNDNGSPEESIHQISREFYRQVDLRVVDLWKQGDWRTFVAMLPEYAEAVPWRRQDARHRDAAGHARLGRLRQAGGDRHRLLREFRNRADQRDLPAALAA